MTKNTKKIKCICGGNKLIGNYHASWCPMFEPKPQECECFCHRNMESYPFDCIHCTRAPKKKIEKVSTNSHGYAFDSNLVHVIYQLENKINEIIQRLNELSRLKGGE